MSTVSTQIDRIKTNVTNTLNAIAEKGVTVPDNATSDNMASLVSQITSGGGNPSYSVIVEVGSERATILTNEQLIDMGISSVDDFYKIRGISVIPCSPNDNSISYCACGQIPQNIIFATMPYGNNNLQFCYLANRMPYQIAFKSAPAGLQTGDKLYVTLYIPE